MLLAFIFSVFSAPSAVNFGLRLCRAALSVVKRQFARAHPHQNVNFNPNWICRDVVVTFVILPALPLTAPVLVRGTFCGRPKLA